MIEGQSTQKINPVEQLMKKVGGQDKYQYLIFLIFATKWVIAAMILFSLNFFYVVPEFKCDATQMNGYKTCEDYVCSIEDQTFWLNHLEKPLPSSISLDYGVIMVCSKQWISSLLQSFIYVGSLLGYIIMSHVGDNLGRKKAEYAAWAVCILGQIVLLTSANLYMVALGSVLLGFGANAAITLHYSFFKELVLGKTRERMIIAIQIAFSIGLSLISLLSYFIFYWKITLGCFILIPSIAITFAFRFVEETPEFTLKEGTRQLVESLNKIAKINHREDLDLDEVNQILKDYHLESRVTHESVSLLDLFSYKSLRTITLVCGFINLTIQFIYDGSILSLDKIGVNVYLNQFLVGLVEAGAAIFGSYIVPRVYRRQFVTIVFAIISILTLLMGIETLLNQHVNNEVDIHAIVELLILACLRFLISTIWGVFFVYVAELFPVEVSSLSFGWISIAGTIGASVSPYIRLITQNMTMFVMSILSLSIVFLVRILKQTKGLPLLNRIEEKEIQQKKKIEKQYPAKESVLSDIN